MCTRHKEPRNGNRAEPSAHRFLAESSDKRPSAQYLRPNLQPIYQIGPNLRRNQPQGSNVGLNVRSSNEPSRLYCSGSGRYKAMNGNLYCIFSTEKYSVIRKRGRQVEVVSKFHPEFFGLNVRRNGPPPSICVRSFSPITSKQSYRSVSR